MVRAQAFAEAFDPYKLDRLARYETHLDRKLERTLVMPLKLQDLRQCITEEDTRHFWAAALACWWAN